MLSKLRYLQLMPCPLCGFRLGIGYSTIRHMIIWHPDIGEKGKEYWLPTVVEARKKWMEGYGLWKRSQLAPWYLRALGRALSILGISLRRLTKKGGKQ